MHKFLFLGTAIALFIGCAAHKNFKPMPEEFPAALAVSPLATNEQIAGGYALFTGKCGACHKLFHPSKYTVEEWQPILKSMFKKAKIANGSEQEMIQMYVASKAKMTKAGK